MPPSEFAGRFGQLEQVAQGGMGCVSTAADHVIGRRVAIKTLRLEYREDERAATTFADEGRVTGQLEHPNVVPIYDMRESSEGELCIVMRLIQGQSLTQLLRQQPPATLPQATDLLRRFVGVVLRVCDALSYAHGRGVIHCDVKPDNVMLGEHGEVYLMDWGVALTKAPRAAFGGTAAYMAPEQLLGRTDDIDARTDVFGLGGVLYEILTGIAPNDGASVLAAARGQNVRTFTPRALWTQLPPELCRITTKALAPEREHRYPSVAALRAELEQFLKGGGWFDTLTFKDGDCIVREGEAGSSAYIVQDGTCEVCKSIGGERVPIRRLGPGDVFGETAVFSGAERTASIFAIGDVTLRCITGDALNRELDQNPILAAFVRSLANLFRETDAALAAHGIALDSMPAKPPR